MKKQTKTVKADFTFWYPANREYNDVVLPGLEAYPVKRKKFTIVPLTSEGHIVHANKPLCGKSKRELQRDKGCTCGKTSNHPLAAIEVCGKCLEAYKGIAKSEMKRIKVWNEGGFKVF